MFTESRIWISATEIAEHLGVSRSTACHYAQTLISTELIVEGPGNGFRLGPKVMELARIARRGYGLSDMAIPVMREIAAEFHETVLLTKRLGSAIICLEREEWPGHYVRFSYERGSRLSLNAGASALVLLAWLPERYVRELVASENLVSYTNKTLTGAQEILDRLAQIRRDGFSVARGEVDTNTMAIAAPIFDSHGDVSAALSLVMLDSRLTEAEQPAAIVKLVEYADRLS